MKKSLTLNLKDVKSYTSERFEGIIKNRRKLILTLLSVIGLWFGTKLYINYPNSISDLIKSCMIVFESRNIIKVFTIMLSINLIPVLISLLNGFFAFGMPFSMISPCISGIITGAVNAWIFNVHRLNGVFFALLSIIPFSIIITIMLLVSCNESIALSGQMTKTVFFKEAGDRGEIKNYFIKHIIIIAATLVVTVLQAIVIINLYSKLFV